MKETRVYEAEHPLSEAYPNMQIWNGGMTVMQMEWLKEVLERACKHGESVMVASHHPVGR